MTKNGLIYPRLLVAMNDGAEWEIQPIGPDQIAWEAEAVRRKYASFQHIPATWQTYLAWHASRREGLIPVAVTWDEFRTVLHRFVQPADMGDAAEDDAIAEDGDLDPDDAIPFAPAPGTGSS